MKHLLHQIGLAVALGCLLPALAVGCGDTSGSEELNATEVTVSDADIQAAVESAADGVDYMSEADYPYSWVYAELAGETVIDEALLRQEMVCISWSAPSPEEL